MQRVAVVVACAAGCGRLDFDTASSVDSAPATLSPCGPRGATAPDPLTITGTTFQYVDFMGDKQAVANVDIAVLDAANGILGVGQSDATGAYSLAFPTGGLKEAVKIVFTQASYFTTTTWLDAPLDRDTAGKNLVVWSAGDGPMWSFGAMQTVYSTSMTTLDSAKSTLVVVAVDCAGVALDGVAISVTPAPVEGDYLGSNGQPAPGATGTMSPAGQFVGFNAQPGSTQITASAPGLMFAPQTVVVPSGDQVTLVEMRPLM